MSIRSKLHGSLHREISGGWPAKEDAAWGAATMKRARNNRWKREYRRETYEVDLPSHCVRRRASKTKSCHVGRRQRHRPGLAIPLVAGVAFRREGNEEGCGVSSLRLHLRSPPWGSPFNVCARPIYQREGCGCANIDATASMWMAGSVCARYRRTRYNAHIRTLSNFAKDRRSSSRFLGTESRARKRPFDWIDRNFKYILRSDGSSREPRRRPAAGLRKISLISVTLDIIIFRKLKTNFGSARNT